MTRIILALIRYILTAAGASEAVASSDEVTQLASAIVAALCAAWGLYESHRHEKLASGSTSASPGGTSGSGTGSAAALLIVGAMLLPMLLMGTACSTVATTAADGTTTSTSVVDWTTVDYVTQKAAKYAVKAVLDNNPKYAEAVAALDTGVAAIFTGAPTEAGLEAAIKALNTGMSDADTATLAGVFKDAYDLYTAKSGKTVLVPTDANVQGLIKALTAGIAEGVALHNSSVTSATSASS